MNALHAEWTKARTLASTGWLLLAAVALTVIVSAAVATVVRCPSGQCAEDLATISLTGIYLGQTVIAIVAVLMISSEYCTGMIRVTLAAMPGRHLEQVGPMTAGLAIQAITGLRSLRIGPWAGLGVLGAWAAAALLAGGLVLRLRGA